MNLIKCEKITVPPLSNENKRKTLDIFDGMEIMYSKDQRVQIIHYNPRYGLNKWLTIWFQK